MLEHRDPLLSLDDLYCATAWGVPITGPPTLESSREPHYLDRFGKNAFEMMQRDAYGMRSAGRRRDASFFVLGTIYRDEALTAENSIHHPGPAQ